MTAIKIDLTDIKKFYFVPTTTMDCCNNNNNNDLIYETNNYNANRASARVNSAYLRLYAFAGR